MEIRRMTNNKMKIFSGDDCMTLPILSIGGHGLISVSSHVVGNELKQMIKSYLDGDVEHARKINDKLYPVYKSMFLTTNPIPVKTAMILLGHDVGPMRMPMELAEGKILEELKESLIANGIKSKM
jgi:4-hydroxy-tetrahydrodipicolinate synthase